MDSIRRLAVLLYCRLATADSGILRGMGESINDATSTRLMLQTKHAGDRPDPSATANMSNVPAIQEFERELVEIAEQYHLLHSRSLISIQQFRPAYELFRKHVPAGRDVLDWGAGNGHFSYFLMRSGYKTALLDFDGLPEVCRALRPEAYDYRRGSHPVQLPFEDHSFDAVASIGVLEHVKETGGNETASLREIKRILKPTGIFICVHLPNTYSWIEFLARSLGRSSHRFSYTKADIIRLSGDAGLRVMEIGRYGALPRNIWSNRLLKAIGNWSPAARLYHLIDKALSMIFRPVCQSYYFVARPD